VSPLYIIKWRLAPFYRIRQVIPTSGYGGSAQNDERKRNIMKIAIITGGSRGVGKSTALNLAKRGVGAILTYNNHD
jgi:hypothetical protein